MFITACSKPTSDDSDKLFAAFGIPLPSSAEVLFSKVEYNDHGEVYYIKLHLDQVSYEQIINNSILADADLRKGENVFKKIDISFHGWEPQHVEEPTISGILNSNLHKQVHMVYLFESLQNGYWHAYFVFGSPY